MPIDHYGTVAEARSYLRSPYDTALETPPASVDSVGRSGSATPIIDEEARCVIYSLSLSCPFIDHRLI